MTADTDRNSELEQTRELAQEQDQEKAQGLRPAADPQQPEHPEEKEAQPNLQPNPQKEDVQPDQQPAQKTEEKDGKPDRKDALKVALKDDRKEGRREIRRDNRKADHKENRRDGQTLTCPRCGAPVHAVAGGDGHIRFWGCERYWETGCMGRLFVDHTRSGSEPVPVPFSCPECHQGLHKGFGRNRSVYCACFDKEAHASGEVIFFNEDGSERPQARGTHNCPECGDKLRLLTLRRGAHKGETAFACFARNRHASARNRYWLASDGAPDWEKELLPLA